ncbi:Wzz/FepE/Etk N-terminal domain-containing protein [Paracoccaceae bacterium]|nr:Wzz/FepE/Etk N-terminal domain-containing protein [Paracoccaceae bacterium]
MSQKSDPADDELDLGELVAALWAHKLLITLLTGLSIFLAGYHTLTTEKKFTAKSVFQIEQNGGSSGLNLSGELGALASLAGFSAAQVTSSTDILLERAKGREFILDMKTKFSIDRDPYFNTYDPDYKDPFWRAAIKKIIGWQTTELEKNAIIESNVLDNYRKNVQFGLTNGGAIEISVTHIDPQKASHYTNGFMEEVRQMVEEESNASQALRLNYLSETLADALQEMEETQKNLKNYALKNSTMAQENFISDSLKLDQIRMEQRKVKEIADLLSVIENFIKSGNLDSKSYEALRSSNPLVDDIDFRRILGMSETISAWTWPSIETIDAVNTTLRDRIKRLDVDIANIEENAQIYATSAEDLAKYKRDAKIAEATYTVLIEQVKSQSLAAGFQAETFKVFEYATPPLTPSSPKRNLALTLGAVLGLFVGCALSLINSQRKGVYYTRSALLSNINADLALRSNPIRRLARKSIPDIAAQLSKRQITVLDESDLKLSDKKVIYVMNSGGRLTTSSVTRLLATQSAQSGRNVVVCDTTGQVEKEINEKAKTDGSAFPIHKLSDGINVIAGAVGSSFFTAKTFNSTIKDLAERFDQVFICNSNKNAQLGLLALLEFAPGLVMISGLRKTKISDIKNIKSRQPIDLLFYD